jgi:hypothetical protein
MLRICSHGSRPCPPLIFLTRRLFSALWPDHARRRSFLYAPPGSVLNHSSSEDAVTQITLAITFASSTSIIAPVRRGIHRSSPGEQDHSHMGQSREALRILFLLDWPAEARRLAHTSRTAQHSVCYPHVNVPLQSATQHPQTENGLRVLFLSRCWGDAGLSIWRADARSDSCCIGQR